MKNNIVEKIIFIIVLIAIIGGIIFYMKGSKKADDQAVAQSNTPSLTEQDLQYKKEHYPQYHEIVNPSGFVNTNNQPIKIADYIGKKVVLLDVLTYSCINCQRTFPYLVKWNKEYEDKGLVIIGIHTPEFGFEKVKSNVEDAMKKFGITFPVVMDNDYGTWNAYGNEYWPRKYLIDIDGYVVYDHIGEGKYDETEKKIVELLNERSKRLGEGTVGMGTMPEITDPTPTGNISPETYIGSARREFLRNDKESCKNSSCDFVVPNNLPIDTFAVGGKWISTPESMQLQSNEGVITYHFIAKKVHLVAEDLSGNEVDVELDGKPISKDQSGEDVRNSKVTFLKSDLYTLVSLSQIEEHTLTLKIKKVGLKAFAFTFS